MKIVNLLTLSVLVTVFSCNEKVKVDPIDTVNSAKSGWTTIDLNIDYSIQFSSDAYTGRGYQLRPIPGYFGDRTTLINRKDEQALISATFCDPTATPCLLIQYGDSLKFPLPDSIIPFKNSQGKGSYWNNRVTFGKDGKLFAVLYYGINPGVPFRRYQGSLYTVSRTSGLPQYTGITRFSDSTKQEVLDILSTISPK
ncbi:MAG: hypothetical protein H7Z72_10725 [Bacteroidetes bacterium]|nr:hypothetical protein [Fibrella sp.]